MDVFIKKTEYVHGFSIPGFMLLVRYVGDSVDVSLHLG